AKSKFEKSNIPEANDIVNKRLEHYFSKVENVVVDEKFAAKYQPTIDAQFANLTKDELVQKLVWLQLKDTIASYENASDLNVKTKDRPNMEKMGMDDESRRLFINLGS